MGGVSFARLLTGSVCLSSHEGYAAFVNQPIHNIRLYLAQSLRQLFEAVPDTTPTDSERLVWSPGERAVHAWTFTKNGRPQTAQLTGLEHWFMAFADARNTIIHQGIVPPLVYTNPSNPEYEGPFVFTAEFLLRAAIKVSLAQFGYPDLWRSASWRAVKAAYQEFEAQERARQSFAAGDSSET